MAETKPGKLSKALLAVQGTDLTIKKDASNPHFKYEYATLNSIMDVVEPVLTKNKLLLIQRPYMDIVDGHYQVSVQTQLVHTESDEHIECEPSAVCDGTPQQVGSAITYLRRYGLSAILGLVTEDDDDGEGTRKSAYAAAAEKAPTKKPKKESTPEDKKAAHEKRMKITDMVMEMAQGDEERAADILEAATTTYAEDGVTVEWAGKKSILNITDAAAGVNLGKVRKHYEAWKGPDTEPADGEMEFEDKDIPF